VRASLDKYQARYKRNWDSRVRPKNKDLAVGDFVYLRSHLGGHKLLPKALGPFETLDTDGTYFAIVQGDGDGRVNRTRRSPLLPCGRWTSAGTHATGRRHCVEPG